MTQEGKSTLPTLQCMASMHLQRDPSLTYAVRFSTRCATQPPTARIGPGTCARASVAAGSGQEQPFIWVVEPGVRRLLRCHQALKPVELHPALNKVTLVTGCSNMPRVLRAKQGHQCIGLEEQKTMGRKLRHHMSQTSGFHGFLNKHKIILACSNMYFLKASASTTTQNFVGNPCINTASLF